MATKTAGEGAKIKTRKRARADLRPRSAEGGRGAPKRGSSHASRGPSALALPDIVPPIPSLGEYIAASEQSPPALDEPTPISGEITSISDSQADPDEPEMDQPIVDLLPSYGGMTITNRFRAPSAKNAGLDADGKVIPHQRSEEIAQMVAAMAAGGSPLNTIAVMTNLRPGQLKQFYKNELEHSAAIANAKVASTALAMATSGESDSMTKFWLKSRAKWRDGDSAEDKGANLFNIHIHSE